VPIIVPTGFIQIAPYALPKEIAPAPKGSIHRLPAEIALGNTLGDSL
jgi:hypothetical protein